MRNLILIRHAPAVAARQSEDDFHRPLSARGKKEAERMAALVKGEGLPPDLIISSPADRSLETAHIFARGWGRDIRKILLVELIYKGNPLDQLQTMIQALDDRKARVALVGHNPSLSDLARLLLRRSSLEIPKAGVLNIRFECDSWQDCGPQNASLVSLLVSGAAVETERWAKPLRRELTARLAEAAMGVFRVIDPEGVENAWAELKPALKKSAARLIERAERLRLTDKAWLARIESESRPETDPTKPGPKKTAAPRARPAKPALVARSRPAQRRRKGAEAPSPKSPIQAKDGQ